MARCWPSKPAASRFLLRKFFLPPAKLQPSPPPQDMWNLCACLAISVPIICPCVIDTPPLPPLPVLSWEAHVVTLDILAFFSSFPPPFFCFLRCVSHFSRSGSFLLLHLSFCSKDAGSLPSFLFRSTPTFPGLHVALLVLFFFGGVYVRHKVLFPCHVDFPFSYPFLRRKFPLSSVVFAYCPVYPIWLRSGNRFFFFPLLINYS